MKNTVIDSSVTVKWLNQINEPNLKQADKLLQDAQHQKVTLSAPELSKYEIGNALLKKQLPLHQANEALGTISHLPIKFIPETEQLAQETYKIAQQAHITYYDASFIALAKQENAQLVTDNPKHQGKTNDIIVIALKDY